MKTSLATVALASVLVLGMAGCSDDSDAPESSTAAATDTSTAATPSASATPSAAASTTASDTAPVDLTGGWTQSNSDDPENYRSATITDSTIEVYWVSESDESKALYWAGTYVAPEGDGAHSWDSENDTSKTDSALLASGDATKTFTYADGEVTYEVTALGVTKTVHLAPAE